MAFLLEALSPRALFRVAIPEFFRSGLSMNAMIREAKSMGMSYQRQSMLRDIRSIVGLIKGEYATRNVSRSVIFPINKMVEASLNKDYRYMLHGRATYMSVASGETFDQFVSMYSDKKRSLDAWGDEFIRNWDPEERHVTARVVSVDFRVAEHNEGYGY